MKNNNYLELMKLVKEKNYEEIYNRFGRKTYLRVTPAKIKIEDINKLIAENNLEEIQKKYNNETYDTCMKSIEKDKKVSNIKLKFINPNLVERTKRNVAFALAVSIGFTGFVSGKSISDVEKNIKLYEQKYSDIIEDYNYDNEAYAEYINSLNLTDEEIIMKLLYDMWSNIDGYKTAQQFDLEGYLRLSLYKEGIGVCRNMADDFTAKMNAINPDYEAANLIVYFKTAQVSEIPRVNLELNDTVVTDENNNNNESDNKIFDYTKITGNHMVSCIKLKDKNIILVIDPTNPSIGILKDGKITMLNNKPDGLEMSPIGTLGFGKDAVIDTIDKIVESYSTDDVNIEELTKRFGFDAQNTILEDIKANYETNMYKVKKMK